MVHREGLVTMAGNPAPDMREAMLHVLVAEDEVLMRLMLA